MYIRRMMVAGRDHLPVTPKEQAVIAVNLSGKSTSTGRISGERSCEPPKGKLVNECNQGATPDPAAPHARQLSGTKDRGEGKNRKRLRFLFFLLSFFCEKRPGVFHRT